MGPGHTSPAHSPVLPAPPLHFALIILQLGSVTHQRHVIAGRQDPLRCFVILASHVISTLHRHPHPPGLKSSVDRDRETLLPQKQRSVYFVVTFFDSQDQSGERKKNRGGGVWGVAARNTNLLCSAKDKTPFVLGILMSASRFILSLTSGAGRLPERADGGSGPHPHPPQAFIQYYKHVCLRLFLTPWPPTQSLPT